MSILYVNLKSELTWNKDLLEGAGYQVYRTRDKCGCTPGQNSRDTLLVIKDNVLHVKIMRCKRCTTIQEGGAQ
ncbi:MAG: hypothetical protein M0Q90_14225 [Bacteroidales bacterium]|nr:hypothetical protein [Bacteroidales bacterium]